MNFNLHIKIASQTTYQQFLVSLFLCPCFREQAKSFSGYMTAYRVPRHSCLSLADSLLYYVFFTIQCNLLPYAIFIGEGHRVAPPSNPHFFIVFHVYYFIITQQQAFCSLDFPSLTIVFHNQDPIRMASSRESTAPDAISHAPSTC